MILPTDDFALSSLGKMTVGQNHLEFTCGEAIRQLSHGELTRQNTAGSRTPAVDSGAISSVGLDRSKKRIKYS
jgi:hypothetical protein